MQETNNLQKFYREAELQYQRKGLDFDSRVVRKMVDELVKDAEKNYLKLPKPRTCSYELYTDMWVWQEVSNDIAKKSVGEPIRLDNPPSEYKVTSDFLCSYPREYVQKIRKNDRGFDVEDMDRKFIAMVKERNIFSKNKGYQSRLGMYLENYKISAHEYKKFLKNVDKVILKCHQKLFGLAKNCLICEAKTISNDKLLMVFAEKYLFLREIIDRIKIGLADDSETKYVKEIDSFEVTLDKKDKINHQMMELVHELGHVVSYLNNFKKGKNILKKGRYSREKSAIEIEVLFLKKYYPDLFVAKLENILFYLPQTLFEIELYKYPDRNQGEVYAKCFNRCSIGIKYDSSQKYLFNEDVVYNCFVWLPYAVAYVNTLEDIFVK